MTHCVRRVHPNRVDRLEHGRPIEPSRFLKVSKLSFDAADCLRDLGESVRLRSTVQVMRLAQRLCYHTGSVGVGVHPPNRSRQVVGCNRKQTRIRLLGLLGVDPGLGSLVGEEDAIGQVLVRTIRSRRQAHRR